MRQQKKIVQHLYATTKKYNTCIATTQNAMVEQTTKVWWIFIWIYPKFTRDQCGLEFGLKALDKMKLWGNSDIFIWYIFIKTRWKLSCKRALLHPQLSVHWNPPPSCHVISLTGWIGHGGGVAVVAQHWHVATTFPFLIILIIFGMQAIIIFIKSKSPAWLL